MKIVIVHCNICVNCQWIGGLCGIVSDLATTVQQGHFQKWHEKDKMSALEKPIHMWIKLTFNSVCFAQKAKEPWIVYNIQRERIIHTNSD